MCIKSHNSGRSGVPHALRSACDRVFRPAGLEETLPAGRKGEVVNDGVYKYIDIVGTSSSSIEDAIQRAIAQASKTVRQIQWFEVKEVRGRIDQVKISQFQVTLRLGFRVE